MNNYERIKSMTVDEMANWLEDYMGCSYCPVSSSNDTCGYNCQEMIKQWLLSEVEDE